MVTGVLYGLFERLTHLSVLCRLAVCWTDQSVILWGKGSFPTSLKAWEQLSLYQNMICTRWMASRWWGGLGFPQCEWGQVSTVDPCQCIWIFHFANQSWMLRSACWGGIWKANEEELNEWRGRKHEKMGWVWWVCIQVCTRLYDDLLAGLSILIREAIASNIIHHYWPPHRSVSWLPSRIFNRVGLSHTY